MKRPDQRINQGKNFRVPAGSFPTNLDGAQFGACEGTIGESYLVELSIVGEGPKNDVFVALSYGDGGATRHQRTFQLPSTGRAVRLTLPGPLFTMQAVNSGTDDAIVSVYVEPVTAQGPGGVMLESSEITLPTDTANANGSVDGDEMAVFITAARATTSNALLDGYLEIMFQDSSGQNIGAYYVILGTGKASGSDAIVVGVQPGQFVKCPPRAVQFTVTGSWNVGTNPVKLRPVFYSAC